MPLVLTLFRLNLYPSTYIPASLLLPVFPVSLCLVMPHYPTAFHFSFFSLSHSSISLCTLNLSTFFFLFFFSFPVPLASLRWSHTGSSVMTHVVYSAENTVYSVCVLFYQGERERMERQSGEKETVFILCADNPARNFSKDDIWVTVNLKLSWKEETQTWASIIVPVRASSCRKKHDLILVCHLQY